MFLTWIFIFFSEGNTEFGSQRLRKVNRVNAKQWSKGNKLSTGNMFICWKIIEAQNLQISFTRWFAAFLFCRMQNTVSVYTRMAHFCCFIRLYKKELRCCNMESCFTRWNTNSWIISLPKVTVVQCMKSLWDPQE